MSLPKGVGVEERVAVGSVVDDIEPVGVLANLFANTIFALTKNEEGIEIASASVDMATVYGKKLSYWTLTKFLLSSEGRVDTVSKGQGKLAIFN